MVVCPDCHFERGVDENGGSEIEDSGVVDANGTALVNGDSVTLIKGLKVKGGSDLKVGTKVKNIRLVDGDHNISCKIDNVGAMMLKSQFVKKA